MTVETKLILALVMIALGAGLTVLGHYRENNGHSRIEINLIITRDTTMGNFGIESIIGGLIGAGSEWASRGQQMKDQLRLMQEQEMAGRRMGQFNKDLALQLWKDTNYDAQIKEMQKAGLNVGLMYKGSGPGGSTNVSPGAMPSTSGAPRSNLGMGIQMGLQMELQKAQIANINADTEAKKATVPKIEAEKILTEVNTGNARIDGQIKGYQRELANIEVMKQGQSLEANISIIKTGAEKLIAELKTAQYQSQIGQATKEAAIAQIEADATSAMLMTHFTQGQIIKQNADIEVAREQAKMIAAEIKNMKVIQEQQWDRLSLNERETIVKELAVKFQGQQTAFNTSTAAEFRQYMEALMGGANLANSLKNFKK